MSAIIENSHSTSDAPSTETHLQQLIEEFTVSRSPYYIKQFNILQSARNFAWTFNWSATLLGPMWMAARNLWGMFWAFAVIELVAVVQISRGIWSDLGVEHDERAEILSLKAEDLLAQHEEAISRGSTSADALAKAVGYMRENVDSARQAAEESASAAPGIFLSGLLLLLVVKCFEGVSANWALERRFLRWRSERTIASGFSRSGLGFAGVLLTLMFPVTIYRFTATKPLDWLTVFPTDKGLHEHVSKVIDQFFEFLTIYGKGFFGAITHSIRVVLDAMEVILVGTPWPVVMLVVVALAWRLAGSRTAIFTVASLAYLALFGFWEKSMATIALLGTAAGICVTLGIPLGVWCSKSRKAYTLLRPVLDLMQTMPAFVYLIPVIAFFGIGKPPGVIATVIFGLPPIVRLTALGLQSVPHSVKEAAVAFGATSAYLLVKVELPIAAPSIMTGVNQTILMCLSMVVIASLIGAEGLGGDVLEALQYVAEGSGMLAGIAILLCAMVIDRIVQGRGQK